MNESKLPSAAWEERNLTQPVSLLLLLCGVLGLLMLFCGLEGVTCDRTSVFGTAFVVCTVLWLTARRHFLIQGTVFLGISTLCVLAILNTLPELEYQLDTIAARIIGQPYDGTADMTELGMVLAAVLSLLFFVLECLLKTHEGLYTGVTLLLAFSPALGIRLSFLAVFLLFLFRIAFRALQMTARRGRRSVLSVPAQFRLAGKSGIAVCALLALSFLIASPLTLLDEGVLYDPIYRAEESMNRYIDRLRGAMDTGGKLARGNSYHSGEARLIVSASEQPEEPLYLRGFSGGDYIGGEWEAAPEEAVVYAALREVPEAEQSPAMVYLYQTMYCLLNEAVSDGAAIRGLRVQNLVGQNGAAYEPYYSRNTDLMSSAAGPGIHNYLYFEQKDMQMDWEQIPDPRYADWYQRLEAAYRRQAQETYTRVPTDRVPQITALARENPLTDISEITAFILHELHSRAVYSLTPGWTPFGVDIVEDFLFEKGKGYCQHFAAAATLLYRLYGVPARYATGYVAEPSDFVKRGEGSGYTAILTDQSAHAWVEIFLPRCGWTPVEVTPGSSDSAAGPNAFAMFPGFDRLRFLQIGRMRGWGTEGFQNRSGGRSSGGFHLPRIPGGAVTLLLLCAAVGVPLWLYLRRKYALQQVQGMDSRAAFFRVTELLRFGGVLQEEDGERAVTDKLSAVGVTAEEAARLADIAERAAFGPYPSSAAENAFARDLYYRAADTLYPSLNPVKKVLFKWWRVFE